VEKTREVATSARVVIMHTTRREVDNNTKAKLEKTPRNFNVTISKYQVLNVEFRLSSHDDTARTSAWSQSNWANGDAMVKEPEKTVQPKPKRYSSSTNSH